MGIPATGYSVCGFRYSVGKSDSQYTLVKPYLQEEGQCFAWQKLVL